MKISMSSKCISVMTIALMAAVLAAPVAGQQPTEAGAKSLFYDPAAKRIWPPNEKPQSAPVKPRTRVRPRRPNTGPLPPVQSEDPKVVKHPGIHYWLEMEGKGRVTEDTVFHTGDRIRFFVRSNVDGYLSLWSVDATGKAQRLYPPPSKPGVSNFVKAGDKYDAVGWIVFRPPAEDENLVVFFSRSESEVPMGRDGQISAEEVKRNSPEPGSKALSFELDDDGGYAVNLSGGAVSRQIRLKHQPRGGSQ